jgi:hypothetical protein
VAVWDTTYRPNRKPSFEKTSVPRVIEYGMECVGFGLAARQQDALVAQPGLYDRHELRG